MRPRHTSHDRAARYILPEVPGTGPETNNPRGIPESGPGRDGHWERAKVMATAVDAVARIAELILRH